jgi:hypothetical protein
MPIEAKAQIVIKGGTESLKVLQGVKRATSDVAKEAQKAAKEQERTAKAAVRATEAAARAQQKAARDTAKAQEKGARDAARAAEKSAKDSERAAQREADRWQQLAQKSRDVRIRAHEAATRAAQREAAKQVETAKRTAAAEAQARRDGWRKAGGYLTAGTAGLIAGATTASSTARGIAGVKDVRERITSANEFRERLVRTTGEAGMSTAESDVVQKKVVEASTASGKDIGELMSVLETGQAQFNDLKFYAEHLKEIATISKVAGSDAGDFAKSLGFIRQAFGLTGDQAIEAAYLMKAAAAKGSIEVKNFANDFAPVAGVFAQGTGLTGMEGVRQFLGVAQAGGTLGTGSDVTATMTERFIALLGDTDKMKELKSKAGISVKGKTPEQIINEMATSKKFNKPGMMQDIFGSDVLGRKMITALVSARRRVIEGKEGAIDIGSIAGVSAEAGRTSVAAGFKNVEQEGFFRMQQAAARAQADTLANLETYNSDILMVAETSMRLEEAFGRLSLWADAIAAVGIVGGAVSTVGKLANAGGGGGALAKALPSVANAGTALAAGAGTALAAGSTAVGAATAGALAGTVGAGLAIGGVLGTLGNQVTGLVRQDDKTASDLLADALFEAFNKNDARFQKGSRIENTNEEGTKTLVTIMKENNQKLESIDRGLRSANTKPEAGASREPR